uniref:Uncharacterized protein n=1 Tax=Lactuca sativa TaxID=4236 RepID=A0A9R1WNX8_LACSA|nr:hypothetical protein LSAT_V11C900499740 [Lactuca sativa]
MTVTSCNGVDIIIIFEKQKNISTRQPTSLVVDDKLEEYHYSYPLNNIFHSSVAACILNMSDLCVGTYSVIEQIPEQYTLRHWCQDVIPTKLLKRCFSNSFVDSNSDMTTVEKISTVDCCVSFFSHDCNT